MANCLIKNFSIMYQFKQDLAMAYFPDLVVSDLQSDTYYYQDL